MQYRWYATLADAVLTTSLERAARALCGIDGASPDLIVNGAPAWKAHLPQAHAVIEAIRAPTEAIIAAMEKTVPVDGAEWQFARWLAREHWHSMIDAALSNS